MKACFVECFSQWRSLLTICIVFAETQNGCWRVSLWSHVPDYQGNAPGMDRDFLREPEWRLEWWGGGLKVWAPLHVLLRDSKYVGWTWLVGSARATTAAAMHQGGAGGGGGGWRAAVSIWQAAPDVAALIPPCFGAASPSEDDECVDSSIESCLSVSL